MIRFRRLVKNPSDLLPGLTIEGLLVHYLSMILPGIFYSLEYCFLFDFLVTHEVGIQIWSKYWNSLYYYLANILGLDHLFFFSFYLFSIVMLLKETSASNLAPSSYKRLAQIYVIYFGFNNEPKLLTCASRFDCLDL